MTKIGKSRAGNVKVEVHENDFGKSFTLSHGYMKNNVWINQEFFSVKDLYYLKDCIEDVIVVHKLSRPSNAVYIENRNG